MKYDIDLPRILIRIIRVLKFVVIIQYSDAYINTPPLTLERTESEIETRPTVENWVGCGPKYHVGNPTCQLQKEGMKNFGLSCDDTRDKNDQRLRMKGATGYLA